MKPELPEGIVFDGEAFFSKCPECGNEQADMGNALECEECEFGPMPTLDGADWPHCGVCGKPATPSEAEEGFTCCAGAK